MDEVEKASDFRRVLDLQLKLMDVDYIDFYHFHGIDKNAFDDKIMKLDLKQEAKKAGLQILLVQAELQLSCPSVPGILPWKLLTVPANLFCKVRLKGRGYSKTAVLVLLFYL